MNEAAAEAATSFVLNCICSKEVSPAWACNEYLRWHWTQFPVALRHTVYAFPMLLNNNPHVKKDIMNMWSAVFFLNGGEGHGIIISKVVSKVAAECRLRVQPPLLLPL